MAGDFNVRASCLTRDFFRTEVIDLSLPFEQTSFHVSNQALPHAQTQGSQCKASTIEMIEREFILEFDHTRALLENYQARSCQKLIGSPESMNTV
jgi:hypothetical protein